MIAVAAGSYIAGSTLEEREQAYDAYRDTAGHDAARDNRWFEREEDRHLADLPGFHIDQQLVTHAAYAEFVRDTGAAPPFIDQATWRKQGFQQDYETEVARFNWHSTEPPAGREEHPVVLVTWDEARAYCAWRGDLVGEPRRLPTAAEYEKAARGASGLIYPWGNDFEPAKLNSQVSGPRDTVAVGTFPEGASPHGMLDAAGNVFQWTSTRWPHTQGRMTVKGSAWDDYAGVGRGASMHGRPARARHVIVGFRCAADRAHRPDGD
jgi:formylglycine-generating enzyme required for sulfatase activity